MAAVEPVYEVHPDLLLRVKALHERRRQMAARRLARYYNNAAAFAHDCIRWPEGQELSDYQDEVLEALCEYHRVSVRSLHGAGKAQPCSLVVDTPAGRRKFGDLQVGDEVFGADGHPTTVTGVFERGELAAWRVRFNDGSHTVCSADHLWTVRRGSNGALTGKRWETLPLSDILGEGLTRPNGVGRARKWAVPTASPLVYPYRWVPVDPYTLGAWLGDGTSADSRITSADPEVTDRIRAAGYRVGAQVPPPSAKPSKAITYRIYEIREALRRLGLLDATSRTKFVPTVYLENVPEVRREVLRGLLDTDGFIDKWGRCDFTSVSGQLAADVAWLVRSLGGVAAVHERTNAYGPFWTVRVTLPPGRWFYIERKHARCRLTSQKRYLWRWIDRVEPLDPMPMRCISVAAPDGLYVANDAVVTHNTTTESLAVLWFSITRDAAERDWKVITTAGAWNQLENYLWPEVHKWARLLRWDKLLRDPFKSHELMKITMQLTYGRATSVSPANTAFLEGAHADSIFYNFDESKSIIVPTWDAAEGAFSTEGLEGKEAFALSCSTPGEPIGRFYEIQTQKPGFEDWHVIHVGLEKALAAGRVSPGWADQRRRQWGENSALFANRVLGEFHSSDEDAVIPLAWIEQAVERWKDSDTELRGEGDEYSKKPRRGPLTCVSVDVARYGDDQSAIALIHGLRVEEIRHFFHESETMIAGRTAGVAGPPDAGVKLVVDTDGLGGGVTDILRDRDYEVTAFHGGYATDRKDRSGELGYKNWRSGAWWNMREILDPHPCPCPGQGWCPTHGSRIELPDDPLLLGDLAAPRLKRITDKSLIEIEPKDDTKKRLGRSPDSGDSVVMGFWPGERARRTRRMVAAGRLGSPVNPG